MLTEGKPDRVIAFRMPGESRGTDDMVRRARAAGIPVEVVEPESGSGADVLYTLDGTTPMGDDALEYSAPFAVTSGQVVRASGKETGRKISGFAEGIAP